MEKARFLKFLEVLCQRTEEGKVDWEATAGEEDIFRTWIGEGAIRISSGFIPSEAEGQRGWKVHTAWLMNGRGDAVDELEVAEREPEFSTLEKLFAMARRQARRADELLDSMLDQLQGAAKNH